MPPEFAALASTEVVSYAVKNDFELSPCNWLLRCLGNPGNKTAELTLVDPETQEELPVSIVRICSMEQRKDVVHFGGILSSGMRIDGHVLSVDSAEPIVGTARLSFKKESNAA